MEEKKQSEKFEYASSFHETVIKLLTLHNESVALFQLDYDVRSQHKNNCLDLLWANQSFENTFFPDREVNETVFLKQFFQDTGSSEMSKHYCLYELMVMFRKKCKLNGIK